jgi:bis(5'-nucleosyl)-tetraphosphatase (symmetrical)
LSQYIIGDIQGCYAELKELLELIKFDPKIDRIYLCGDLVNRGPRSLDVLKWAMSHRESVFTVLGNHDLYLLGRLLNVCPAKTDDTMDEIYANDQRNAIVEWLCEQPPYRMIDGSYLVHAGFWPTWQVAELGAMSEQICGFLMSEERLKFLELYFAQRQKLVPPSPSEASILKAAWQLRVMTTIRTLKGASKMYSIGKYSGSLEGVPQDQQPWFRCIDVEGLQISHSRFLYFGHWAAIGPHIENHCIALDSGCVWGRMLTSYCCETGRLAHVTAASK